MAPAVAGRFSTWLQGSVALTVLAPHGLPDCTGPAELLWKGGGDNSASLSIDFYLHVFLLTKLSHQVTLG